MQTYRAGNSHRNIEENVLTQKLFIIGDEGKLLRKYKINQGNKDASVTFSDYIKLSRYYSILKTVKSHCSY